MKCDTWTIEPYRYAHDSIVLISHSADHFKTPYCYIAEELHGRYVNRARGYVLPKRKESELRALIDEHDRRYETGKYAPEENQNG